MAVIPKEVITAVMESASIVDVVSRYTTKIVRKGERYFACCPFHNEKTPSMSITPSRNMFHCFGCGESGTVISFLQKIEKISFSEAVARLADEFHVPFHLSSVQTVYDRQRDAYYAIYARVRDLYHEELLNRRKDSAIDRYIKERGIPEEVIREFRLGYSPADRQWLWGRLQSEGYSPSYLKSDIGLFSKNYDKISFFSNRLMFPIHDSFGHCLAFGGRLLEGEGPKYLNTGKTSYFEKGNGFYFGPDAFREMRIHETAVLCEGYMDVIAFYRAGIKNVFAPLGTAFTQNQAELLAVSGAKTVLIGFDGDDAGKRAAAKAVEILRRKNIGAKVAEFTEYKDPDEYLNKEGPESLKNLLKNGINGLDFLIKNIIVKHGNLDSPEAKEAVVSEVFPYIGSIGSEVGKNAALQSLAEKLHISEKAVSDDFRVFSEKNHDRTKTAATRPTLKTEPPVPAVRTDDSQEFFLFAALVAEPACFEQVRRCIGVEDLVSARAREIYYLLEDAYRKNRLNSDAILSMMEDSSAVRFIVEKLADNEFSSENIKKMIPDLILQERIFILKNKIDDLQFKISHSSGKSRETVDNFIREKIKYEKELSKLKP